MDGPLVVGGQLLGRCDGPFPANGLLMETVGFLYSGHLKHTQLAMPGPVGEGLLRRAVRVWCCGNDAGPGCSTTTTREARREWR